jgi:Skp family chaperone for outer membrane proteins
MLYACSYAGFWRNFMKVGFNFVLVLIASMFFISGCDQLPGGKSDVAILDLSVIAEATGQDELIRVEAEAARNELAGQLQQVARGLDQQLAEEAEKVGPNPTPEQAQFLQQLSMEARTRMNEAQSQAQATAAQVEQGLVTDFRNVITPLAESIAKERGASAVVAVDAYLFWYDPEIDITDEVIAAWRARPAEAVAEAQSELEEVAEELAETEEELAEVEEEVEELKEAIEEAEAPVTE